MAWVPCDGCGRMWYQSHRERCPTAARQFIAEVVKDGRATSDDHPRCPKCGEGQLDWTDRAPRNACDGSEWTTTCDGCNYDYPVQLVVVHRFRMENPR